MFGGGKITADLWHVPSTLVSLLLVGDPETEQWGPCKVFSCIPQEPHPNHTHLLWMTNSDQGRLLYFRHNYNRCFTTNKEKKNTKWQNIGTHLFYGSIHGDAQRNKCTISRSEPNAHSLHFRPSVWNLAATCQWAVREPVLDLVRIRIFPSRLQCAFVPSRAHPNAVPISLNLHYSARLENVPSLLRRDKKMSRMPQNASEMRKKKKKAQRWTDKESRKLLIHD